MLPLVFISIFLAALALLIFGIRGRRIGDEPRCRNCKYNLTGAVSANCPECGAVLSLRSIQWGIKKPRLFTTGAAMLLVVGEVSFLYGTYNRATWLQYYPFSNVLKQAQGGDLLAIAELKNRHKNGLLTIGHRNQIIEASVKTSKLKPIENAFAVHPVGYRLELSELSSIERSRLLRSTHLSSSFGEKDCFRRRKKDGWKRA